ncbi:hypothetical protein MRX96_025559 [Rhipicephalus microplus]
MVISQVAVACDSADGGAMKQKVDTKTGLATSTWSRLVLHVFLTRTLLRRQLYPVETELSARWALTNIECGNVVLRRRTGAIASAKSRRSSSSKPARVQPSLSLPPALCEKPVALADEAEEGAPEPELPKKDRKEVATVPKKPDKTPATSKKPEKGQEKEENKPPKIEDKGKDDRDKDKPQGGRLIRVALFDKDGRVKDQASKGKPDKLDKLVKPPMKATKSVEETYKASKPDAGKPETKEAQKKPSPPKKPPEKKPSAIPPAIPPAKLPAKPGYEVERTGEITKLWFAKETSVREVTAASAGDAFHTEDRNKTEGETDQGTPPKLTEDQRTLFFHDGRRRIDIVLAYELSTNPIHERYRRIFQENLIAEGLELEIETAETSFDGYTYFVKVHAPWVVLTKYAEQLHLRMPVKKKGAAMAFPKIKIKPGEKPVFPDMKAFESDSVEIEVVGKAPGRKKLSRLQSPFPYDKKLIPDENEFYNAEFVRQRERMYLISNKDTFFSQAYAQPHDVGGIYNLLSAGAYLAAYPLHDGPFGKGRFNRAKETYSERRVLYAEWGRARCWYKEQPLFLIRRYFGEKVGLYFAWVGFYTTMLILPAFVGVFTSLYGLAYMLTNKPTEESCDPNTFGNFTLCPSCMKLCPYDQLKNKCTIQRIVSIFDNSGTVGFSVFMSLWATIFIEFWKRQQVVLAWEWNLSNVDTLTEVVNPEYEAKARVYKLNPVTLRYEPHVPFWERIGRIAAANVILLFLLVVVLCTVMGVIGYRIIMVTYLSSKWSRLTAHVATTVSASMINLMVILSLNKNGLGRSAITSTASHSRCFLFTFLNNYSSLIYISFFKGRFSGDPGSEAHWKGYTLDKCEGGCLYEVFVQLATVMLGQQAIRTTHNIVVPIFKAWWRQRRRRLGKEIIEPKSQLARWEQDFNLEECPKLAPFDEYLEMTIQFGFVTLFVAAFPLAPLFALINNVCEIRLDAYRIQQTVASTCRREGAEYRDFDDAHRPNNGTLHGAIVRECRYVGFREPPGTENEYQLSETFWVITTAQLCFVVIFEHVVFFITGVVAGMIPAMPKSVAQRMKREQIVVQDLIAKLQDSDAAASVAATAQLMMNS